MSSASPIGRNLRDREEKTMGKLVVGTFVSLDGVMQAPGAPNEDTEGGFEHGGWTVPLFDEGMGEVMTELVNKADALLLGRKTYEIFAASWPLVGDEDPIGSKMNSMPKYVASRTLESVEWNNSSLLQGDVADEVPKLKEQHGEINVTGSGNLIQSLLRDDLVDEFQLLIFPVLVGSGKRLFAGGTIPRGLRLVDTQTSETGVTINRYERTGELEHGAMGPEQV
jgi:dihydrofolate reductase